MAGEVFLLSEEALRDMADAALRDRAREIRDSQPRDRLGDDWAAWRRAIDLLRAEAGRRGITLPLPRGRPPSPAVTARLRLERELRLVYVDWMAARQRLAMERRGDADALIGRIRQTPEAFGRLKAEPGPRLAQRVRDWLEGGK